VLTTELLFRHPQGFGITTASPLQIAITRAIDGRPIGDRLWKRPEIQKAFGYKRPPQGGTPPRIFGLIAAIRCAKSILAADRAVIASQTVDVSRLKPGDEVRIPILAPTKDAARQTYTHLVGTLSASPFLKSLMMGEPTGESVWLRHPSGRGIEIVVTALAKYGVTLTSRWIATCIFDEAPRMVGVEDGVKNLDEAIRAVGLRILPGGQILLIGSPYAAFGPVYDLVQERFGKPGPDVVIVRAPGADLNPTIWTPEACEEAARTRPQEYRTDVLAEFDDPEDALFNSLALDRAIRKGGDLERKPEPGVFYVASMDPGARASAWTFTIVGQVEVGKFSVVLARQWRATRRGKDVVGMDPRTILAEIKEICDRYHISDVNTDQFSAEALQALADDIGINLLIHNIDADLKWTMAMAIRTALDDGAIELPPMRELREDLVRVKKKLVNSSARPMVHLPTSGDGRHCDFFTAVGLCMVNAPEEPIARDYVKPEEEEDDPDFAPPGDDPWQNAAKAWS
jgi:hypothetical protein